MERVSIFVDVQNIYHTTRKIHHCHFDYKEFWKRATYNREVVKAFAYATDRNDQKQQQFQNRLRQIGLEVKLKPFVRRRDGSAKGDWDVGITMDVMEYAPKSDVVVLASGDGDFDMLVSRIRDDYGTDVEVYGVAPLTASSLKAAATKFLPIEKGLLLTTPR